MPIPTAVIAHELGKKTIGWQDTGIDLEFVVNMVSAHLEVGMEELCDRPQFSTVGRRQTPTIGYLHHAAAGQLADAKPVRLECRLFRSP